MPADGQCLYHALGHFTGQSWNEVREQLGTVTACQWERLCDWDEFGEGLSAFKKATGVLQTLLWGRIAVREINNTG